MAEVAYSTGGKPQYEVEIVVHVDETLGDSQRESLVNYLTSTDGVNSAEFCPLRYHLMLVQYDRSLLNSQEIIGRVNSQDIHAELIGPV